MNFSDRQSSVFPYNYHMFIFSRTTGPISTILSTDHPWVKEIQVCSTEGSHPFARGYLFVCLFIWVYRPTQEYHSHGHVTMTGEGLQILTYARHSWPLSIEGSLACHTYCDKGHLFITVISEDPWHSHLLLSIWQWSCHYLFLRVRSVPLHQVR